MNSTVKTILFWMAMILLAVLLWKMASTGGQTAREQTPSYTDFQAQVEKGNVSDATIMLSAVSAEVDGEFREPKVTKFRVTVPNATLNDLTKELEAKNVDVNIKPVSDNNWMNFLIDGVPFILLLVVFLIMMRQMQAGGNKALSFGKSRARLLTAQQ
ncbi:MAG: ATP-dependent metallopeptidase FtsH/Yme1/Tma family protein, partial [Candidatus Acidiferrales bacterium]